MSKWLISIIFTCNIEERYIGNLKKTLQYPSSYTPRLLSHMTILNIEAGTHLDMCNDLQKIYEVNFQMLLWHYQKTSFEQTCVECKLTSSLLQASKLWSMTMLTGCVNTTETHCLWNYAPKSKEIPMETSLSLILY